MPASLISRIDMEAMTRRAGPGPMIPNPHPGVPSQQHAMQQQQAAARLEREKREDAMKRSQKPVDRNLPNGIDEIVIGDSVQRYKAMREVERRLDVLMMRKRLDVQDSVYRDAKQYGTLRLWISNTVSNQAWQYDTMDAGAFDFNSGIEPTFRVKIEGKLLDDLANKDAQAEKMQTGSADTAEAQDATNDGERASKRQKTSPQPPPSTNRRKLSHFFRSIAIDFDRPAKFQPDGYTRIEWHCPEMPPNSNIEPPREADFDRLEFERKADENINVTINLVKSEHPEQYRLARPLAELLDMEEADRDTVLMGIWDYIKLAHVRMDEDKRHIYCDQRLQEVFHRESIYFPHLPQMVQEYLIDPPPLQLAYTIRVDKAFHASPIPQYTIYDIRVPLPSSSNAASIFNTDESALKGLKDITAQDDLLALTCTSITASQAKHNFLTSLAADPANFVKRWTSSQKRDLDVILGKGPCGEEDWQGAEWRKGGESGVWGSREAWEGVGSWLGRANR